jgi:hypothetical protein
MSLQEITTGVKPHEHSFLSVFQRDYGVILLLPGAEIGRRGRLEELFLRFINGTLKIKKK